MTRGKEYLRFMTAVLAVVAIVLVSSVTVNGMVIFLLIPIVMGGNKLAKRIDLARAGEEEQEIEYGLKMSRIR